jgi:DNA invertase Pin-like site-specific DNA recombinase
MRCAIYARVSTVDQDTENQLQQLREFCQRQGDQVVAEYIDIASGGRADRQKLKEMFLHASQRKFALLVS